MSRHFLVTIHEHQNHCSTLPGNAPAKSENGQSGTNQCGTESHQDSQCQNAFMNSLDDFCLFGPPNPGPGSLLGKRRIEVAWCTKAGTGTRLIPDGAITGAHFIETPDFVQVTGFGQLTVINIPAGDAGLDPHGADGNGNPIGGLVFSSAFGQLEQIHEWTRVLLPGVQARTKAATLCQHIYDVMGCQWNMPGNYDAGFSECLADSGEPMGVYGTSTFHQGQPATPAAHPAPASSNCQFPATIGSGFTFTGSSSTPTTTSTTASTTSSGLNTLALATSTSTTSSSSITPAPTSLNSGTSTT
ncbi:hypothetical protein BJ912DRAFT_1032780, partial [Pholiota molesta]